MIPRSPLHPRSPQPRPADAGFALLITITLLAFLVLLLVSLASLTRVETQVAGNNQQLSQARQNAFTALGIAIGRLQKAAGPDQRTTAQADLLNPSSGAAVTSTGASRWTGVWGNTQASSAYSQTPTLIDWLVSGNETAFTADESASADFGKITASPTPVYKPDNTVAGLTTSSQPTDTTITIAGQPARLLVGAGTLGNDPANLDKFVVAPLRNIEVPASAIPGLAGTTATVIGRYAYWIGDEGVKAKVNLVDPYSASTETPERKRYAYQSAQRTGAELMDDDNSIANNSAGQTAFTPVYSAVANTLTVENLVELRQLPLLGANTTVLQNTARNRFHDITTHSSGVLADQAKGGLRRDLTAAFATNSPAGAVTAFLNSRIYTRPDNTMAGSYDGPPWAVLRDYYRLNAGGATSVTAAPPTLTTQGIAPVVAGFQLFLAGGVNRTTGGPIRYHLVPAVVLWNPYNVTLNAQNYHITLRAGSSSEGFDRNVNIVFLQAESGAPATLIPATLPAAGMGANPARGLGLVSLELALNNGPALAPGQAVVYTLRDNQPMANIRQTLTLEAGVFAGGLKAGFYDCPNETLTALQATAVNNLRLTWSLPNQDSFSSWGAILRSNNASGPVLQAIDRLNAFINRNTSVTVPNYESTVTSTPNPGWRYAMLGTDQANSQGLRWIANNNPRAYYSMRSPSDSPGGLNRNSSFTYAITTGGTAPAFGFAYASAGSPSTTVAYPSDLSALDAPSAALFAVPRIPAVGGDYAPRILSIGEFQMADLYVNDPSLLLAPPASNNQTNVNVWTASNYSPAYPLGNSLADPRISADQIFRVTTTAITLPTYDHSYLLNRAVWDGYFLSTVSQVNPPVFPLPNSRFTPYSGGGAAPAVNDLRDLDKASANLAVDGAFNVNSTSVNAWAAVLASRRNVAIESFTATADTTAYPGSTNPLKGAVNPAANAAAEEIYNGYRELTDAQIQDLATQIVTQVRTLGPFLSLSHFINRPLLAVTASDKRGLKGALQAAIDTTSPAINGALLAPARARLPASAPVGGSFNVANNSSVNPAYYYQYQMGFGETNADTGAHASPGFLTQAHLLKSLAPVLSARSDTFRIRVYAENVNPLDSTQVLGRAWCEAIVQRTPDYVSAADLPETRPASLTEDVNKKFGRGFKVVAFRWLQPSEI